MTLITKMNGNRITFDLTFKIYVRHNAALVCLIIIDIGIAIGNQVNVIDLYHGSSIRCTAYNTNNNVISINNRREWTNSIDVEIDSTQTSNFFTLWMVKEKNDSNDD